MPGIIGSQSLNTYTELLSGGGAYLDSSRTYTVEANDILAAGYFYNETGRTGSRTIDLALYNITQSNALITTVTLTIADVSVAGWASVQVDFDLSPYVGDEVAIGYSPPSGTTNTYRDNFSNNDRSSSATLDDPFVVNSSGARVYPVYFEAVDGASSFILTDALGDPATPTFNQTITVTTSNWGVEDPTSVDITDSDDNTITLSLTATATEDEYTFDMPTISETEGTSISGLLQGSGSIRIYSATGDDVSQSTTISYGAVWENVATLESGFNTEPTSQLTPSPVAGDQLAGQAEVEFLTNGNINADEGVWSILHVQASTGTIYTHSLNTAAIEDVAGVDISVPRLGRAKVKANVGIRAHTKVSAFKL